MPPGKLPAGVLHLVHIGGQNAHRYRQEITERRHFIREMDTPAFQGLIGKPCCYQTIYISPQGKTLTQSRAKELARMDNIAILCGHYEGVDQRVIDEICDEEISIGDYVLTGGELPALVLADCISRMVEGVLPNEEAYTNDSHYSSLLEAPQYTRPYEWRGRTVPDILLSGNHKKVAEWKRERSLERTLLRRPDMLEKAHLSDSDIAYLERKGYKKNK